MRVCAIQMNVITGDRKANRAAVTDLTERAVRSDCPPDVIILPELWSTGYALDRASELASPGGEADAEFLGELAIRHHVAFAGGSVLAEVDGRIRNRAQVIDKKGMLTAFYDKIHLFRLMDEERYLDRGNDICLFELEGMRCALAICYDIRFCEFVRRLAVEGAEALFVSAEWPLSRRTHWEILLRARAVENQMYVAACNRCGSSGQEIFAGQSMMIAPDGTIMAQGGGEESLVCADMDIEAVRRMRKTIPVFEDRVPLLY